MFTGELSSIHTAQVLGTKWHEYSDEAIQSTLSRLSSSNSPADIPNNPYNATLRVLSSAVYRLSKARAELEESRRVLLEKEAARRARAEQLMKELQPSEQDVARRVLQSLFPDDDESRREVQRKHSDTVRLHLHFQRTNINGPEVTGLVADGGVGRRGPYCQESF